MAGLDTPMEKKDGCLGEIVPYPRVRGYTLVGVRDTSSGMSIAAHKVVNPDGSADPCSIVCRCGMPVMGVPQRLFRLWARPSRTESRFLPQMT